MNNKRQARLLFFSIFGHIFLFHNLHSYAQIIPDQTLGGNENSRISNSSNTQIQVSGGARRGSSLFHSFRKFNIGEQNQVFFIDPGVQNIIARVTGGEASYINGKLGILQGQANLFFINPHGITFGPNSRLDLSGSFVATTAKKLLFDNDIYFSAINPNSLPLLTIQSPIGIEFGGQPEPIVSQAQGNLFSSPFESPSLNVGVGQTLALLGGDIIIRSGDDFRGGLTAIEGDIEVAALGAYSRVGLKSTSPGFIFNYNQVQEYKDVEISNNSLLSSSSSFFSGGTSGNIDISGKNISITDSSSLTAFNLGDGIGGTISVNASETLSVRNNSRLFTDAASFFFLPSENTSGGNIRIKTKQLSITNGSRVETRSFADGSSGKLSVKSDELILIDGAGGVSTLTTDTLGEGDSGDQIIQTQRLELLNGGQISSSTKSVGNGGDILVKDAKTIIIKGQGENADGIQPSGIFARTEDEFTIGNSGSIELDTGQLFILDGGSISVSSINSSDGQAGRLSVNATKTILLSGLNSSLEARSESPNSAGELSILTEDLRIQDGATISASTENQGSAGKILIQSSHVDVRDPFSGILSNTTGIGSGGDIEIQTNVFSVSDDAVIDAQTTGDGNGGRINISSRQFYVSNGGKILTNSAGDQSAGDISILVDDTLLLENEESGIFASTSNGSLGSGGNINVNAKAISISDDAVIDAQTRGDGRGGGINLQSRQFYASQGGKVLTNTGGAQSAGDISILVDDTFILEDPDSGIFASTSPDSSGSGGSISVQPKFTVIQKQAGIAVDSEGSGVGGDIFLKTNSLLLQNQGFISAETDQGDGGDININVSNLLLAQNGSRISARSGREGGGGDGGNISIIADVIIGNQNGNNDILANAFAGNGGSIFIDTEALIGFNVGQNFSALSNDINASSTLGLPGSLLLNVTTTSPTQSLAKPIPNTFVSSSLRAKSCARNLAQETDTSEFYITSHQVSPTASFYRNLEELDIFSHWISDIPIETKTLSQVESTVKNDASSKIVEAKHLVQGSNGALVLSANAAKGPARLALNPGYFQGCSA